MKNLTNFSDDESDNLEILNLFGQENTPFQRSNRDMIDENRSVCQGNFIDNDYQQRSQKMSQGDSDDDFLKKSFGEEDTNSFERYLEINLRDSDVSYQQTANFNFNNNFLDCEGTKKIFSIKQKKVPPKTLYRQKNRSPRTIFNYHGVDIQVLYQCFDSFQANCLVLPYKDISLCSLRELGLNKEVICSIFRAFDDHKIEQMQQNEELLIVNCKKGFKNKNYAWLYLYKKPVFKYIAEYSIKKLEDFVLGVLGNVCLFRNNESIVFPDFQWLGVDRNVKCEIFFSTLIRGIYQQQKKRKISLKKVSVCCQSKQSFFEFTAKLRQLSDVFMINGMIPLARQV